MSKQKRRILVTSALPYANGAIHLGHMLEYIQTDIWARYQRAQGHECYFAWADDAHGTPIMLRAEAEGITAEQLIAKMNAEHQQDFKDFGLRPSPSSMMKKRACFCLIASLKAPVQSAKPRTSTATVVKPAVAPTVRPT
jgi:hypothetical protein